ncbi:MAG: TRAP transporter TatT component family protein [Ignavibacteria bacterium]|nr:TRAP transporter TatT component family protein [Ignavibacteria bacterium]
MKVIHLLISSAVVLFVGCIQQIAISTVASIVDDGFEGFTEEQDLDFAEKALPANLKLLEVMLKSDPENDRLLLLLSEGYNSYSLGFVEDRDLERARMFYVRARDYGLRILRQDDALAKAIDGSVDDLKVALSKLDEDEVPGVFWSAFGWISYINLTRTSPDALADLPRAEAMINFVIEKDSSFYFGSAHLILGALYGSRPRILGGDVDLSKQHFEKALRINQGKFLMTYVYYAQSYAVQTLNDSLFEELLAKVDEASLEILPSFRLANAIAKKKAKLLLERKPELF